MQIEDLARTWLIVGFRDIGNKIESIVKPKGYSIVRQYTGHGIDQRVSQLVNHGRYTCADVDRSSTATPTSYITADRRHQERWKSAIASPSVSSHATGSME
jgi:hypothetical protein